MGRLRGWGCWAQAFSPSGNSLPRVCAVSVPVLLPSRRGRLTSLHPHPDSASNSWHFSWASQEQDLEGEGHRGSPRGWAEPLRLELRG